MSKLVSIIVPAYNVENYISACLDSLVNQTYSNIEIILINDGSKDNTNKICEEYARNHSKIKYINKPNSGVANTRNLGLDMCSGDYLMFVDSDDWIETNAIELLVNNIGDADIIKFNCNKEINKNKWVTRNFKYKNHIMNKYEIEDIPLNVVCPKKFSKKYGYLGEFWCLYDKLYSMKIINKIRFNDKMHFCEDSDFFLRILGENLKIKVLDKSLYYYRNNTQSCMRKYRKAIIDESKIVCDCMNNTLKSINKECLFPYFKIDRFCHCLVNFSLAENFRMEDIKNLCEDQYWNIKSLKKFNKELSKKRKILFFLAKNKMYWLLYLICKI